MAFDEDSIRESFDDDARGAHRITPTRETPALAAMRQRAEYAERRAAVEAARAKLLQEQLTRAYAFATLAARARLTGNVYDECEELNCQVANDR
jgi:hypothetical protein